MTKHLDYNAFLEHAQKVAMRGDVPGSPGGVPVRAGGGVAGDAPCLSAHISPHVKYFTGASLLTAHRGGKKEDQVGGGLRGSIAGFSVASRRRLMRLISSIRRDADLPLFITLTYPDAFPDAKSSKKHIDTFFKRLKRAFPGIGLIWKLEPQKRGAPHYHMLAWNVSRSELYTFVPKVWFDIAGNGDDKHLTWHMGGFNNEHCVQQVRTWNGVRSYASKYLGKTFEVEGWTKVGRYWGVINRESIPFGELQEIQITRSQAVQIMRYQRRFSGLGKFNNKSLTIFCDADQWINRIIKSGLPES